MLAAARRSLEDLDAAMSQIGKRAREASHTFSIAGGQVTCAYILPQALKEFGTRRPELRIEVVDGDPSTFLTRPISGGLLLLAAILLAIAVLPMIRKQRDVVFGES